VRDVAPIEGQPGGKGSLAVGGCLAADAAIEAFAFLSPGCRGEFLNLLIHAEFLNRAGTFIVSNFARKPRRAILFIVFDPSSLEVLFQAIREIRLWPLQNPITP
jgi:hypothetical protein